MTQQKSIHIKIEAFGAIERQIPADLSLQCESEIQVSEVLNQLLSPYPDHTAHAGNAAPVQSVKTLFAKTEPFSIVTVPWCCYRR